MNDVGTAVSIGDVLDQLRPEFADITISKIRFLESQGLIDPERTASGYRKFSPSDIERLRFILREQREHFLPLKVIKERLDQLDARRTLEPPPRARRRRRATPRRRRNGARRRLRPPPLFEMARREAESGEARAVTAGVHDTDDPDDYRWSENEVVLTRAELAQAAGISDDELAQLEEYGLVLPTHTSRDRVLVRRRRARHRACRFELPAPRHRGAAPPHVPRVRRARSRAVRAGAPAVPAPAQSRSTSAHARDARRALRARPAVAHRVVASGRSTFAHGLTCRQRCSSILLGPTVAVHVERLAVEIERDHPGGVLLVGVLKGALIFLADLARAMTRVNVELDFMSISRFAPDSGRVKILHDLDTDISGRDVVLVEDMVDTGLTLAYLMGRLAERGPRSLSACTLLDRPRRRIVPHDIRYRGLVLDDEYVLGYGLHAPRPVPQPALRRRGRSRCRRRDAGGIR